MLNELLAGFKEIFSAPFKDLSVLWLLIPMFSLWLILEIYFELHKSEQLGWNTALGNGVSLCWIIIGLLRELFSKELDLLKAGVLIIILLYGVFVIFISFTHKLSAKITYALASPTLIYFIGSVAVLWAFDLLQINFAVFIDLLILLGLVVGLLQIIKHFMPEELGVDKGPELPELGGPSLPKI